MKTALEIPKNGDTEDRKDKGFLKRVLKREQNH